MSMEVIQKQKFCFIDGKSMNTTYAEASAYN